MPTLRMMNVPPPTDWDEFEEMTHNAFVIKWNSPNLQRHGRQGQAQQGVDIYGPDYLEQPVGIQCKKIDHQISIEMIKDEANKAENFVGENAATIRAFYMATTTPPDAILQREVRLLSKQRQNEGKFPIGIFFWPDIWRELVKNKEVFRLHYPDLKLQDDEVVAENPPDLAILDIAYVGSRLNIFLDHLFGEVGAMVQENPNQVITLTEQIAACSTRLVDSGTLDRIHKELAAITTTCLKITSGAEVEDGWHAVDASARFVEQQVENLTYRLSGRELAIFRMGKWLAVWDEDSLPDHYFTEEDKEKLLSNLRELITEDAAFNQASDLLAGYQTEHTFEKCRVPHMVYNILRSSLGQSLMMLDDE